MIAVVDTEGIVRDWARAEPHITAAVGNRVWFGTPQSYAKSPPQTWVILSLVSEVHQNSDLGMQQALIQFTIWGRTVGDKAAAAAVAVAVQQAARDLQWGPPVAMDSAVIQSASVSQRRWFPDSVNNLPRYVVDVLFTIRGAELN